MSQCFNLFLTQNEETVFVDYVETVLLFQSVYMLKVLFSDKTPMMPGHTQTQAVKLTADLNMNTCD